MRKASLITALLSFIYSFSAMAQESTPEMADGMRADGKIYVVVLVLATIFVGIIAYLIRIERKIKKLEQHS